MVVLISAVVRMINFFLDSQLLYFASTILYYGIRSLEKFFIDLLGPPLVSRNYTPCSLR